MDDSDNAEDRCAVYEIRLSFDLLEFVCSNVYYTRKFLYNSLPVRYNFIILDRVDRSQLGNWKYQVLRWLVTPEAHG